ncbi:MAG: hypothetical protein GXO88_07750 [Chlorobi bacterium]|nr:hypothetical protein [Chlorobiota bacterium]
MLRILAPTLVISIQTRLTSARTQQTSRPTRPSKNVIQDDTLTAHNTRILAVKSATITNVSNITINSDSIAALRADVSNTALNKVERFSSIQGQAKFGLTSALTINNLIFLNGNLVDITQYSGVGTDTLTFKTPLSLYDNLVVFYQVGANTSNQIYWYGVEWDTTVADPSVTRIGNVQYQASLPIQNGMVRAVVNDDRTVNYYLDPNNSNKKADGTTANLTGADGQVMVIVPTHWERFERVGTKRRIELATVALPGFTKVTKYAIGAYEAYYNTTTGKLESRSGVMPTTNKTRANFRTYAAARGTGWHQLDYNSYFDIFSLYLTEYASFDSQTVLPGATNATSADWSTYNGSNPVIATGASNSYGNASASVPFSIANFVGGTATLNSHEADYRGIENVYGHIWQFVDGININYTSSTSAYAYIDSDPSTYADDTPTNYVLAGKITNASGYITSLLDNSLLPQTVGGSSSTYMTDYTWASSSQAGVWRVALWGASLSYSSNGGFLAASFDSPSGRVYGSIGGRLCLKIE